MGPTFAAEPRADWLSLYRLLERMDNARRRLWLDHCCRLASVGQDPVRVDRSTGEADDVWWDYRMLCGQGRLTADRAGDLAVRILRGELCRSPSTSPASG